MGINNENFSIFDLPNKPICLPLETPIRIFLKFLLKEGVYVDYLYCLTDEIKFKRSAYSNIPISDIRNLLTAAFIWDDNAITVRTAKQSWGMIQTRYFFYIRNISFAQRPNKKRMENNNN